MNRVLYVMANYQCPMFSLSIAFSLNCIFLHIKYITSLDDTVNLDNDDDNDSICNPVPQLQRYDDGDAPEVPVEPFPPHMISPAKEVHVSVSSPV